MQSEREPSDNSTVDAEEDGDDAGVAESADVELSSKETQTDHADFLQVHDVYSNYNAETPSASEPELGR